MRTATSANWHVTYRPRLTTFALILTGLSHSIVNYQCSASSGSAHVACGSTADHKHPLILRPHLKVKRKKRIEGQLSGVDRTFRVALETDAISQNRTQESSSDNA